MFAKHIQYDQVKLLSWILKMYIFGGGFGQSYYILVSHFDGIFWDIFLIIIL